VHDVDVTSLYRQIKPYLLDLRKNQVNWESAMFNNTLRTIIQKTLDLWEVVDDTNDHVFDHQVKHCEQCKNLPADKKCIQRVPVHLNNDVEFVNKWEGVGLTRVSKAQQMQPRKVSNCYSIPISS